MARLLHASSVCRRTLRTATLAAAAALAWVAAGCDGDDEPLPAYCQELSEMETDGNGFAARLLTDSGDTLTVENRCGGYQCDTIYRIAPLYTRQGNTATLHGVTRVLSPLPRTYSATAIKTDPVRLDAAWRGGRYLNLRLTLQTGGTGHRMGFIDRGTEQAEDGTHILHVELLHDQNGNPLHFPRETIVSCPLYPYADRMRPGLDSVHISVRTFDGTVSRTFTY